MLRSLWAGVSGMRNHQVRLDVTGNNIANVNTTAFKSGRVTFKEGFAQLVAGASRPPGDHGGVNPIQVGLGSQIGSVDTLYAQGNIETTGISTDLALQGPSFFVVAKGNQHYYTRAGNFQLDANGNLVSPTNGFVVQGRMAVNGVFQDGFQPIKLPFGQKTAARATTTVHLAGNVNASANVFTGDPLIAADRTLPENAGAYKDVSITAYDALGEKHELKMVLYKTAPGEWGWAVDPNAMEITGGITVDPTSTNPFTFNPDGTLDTTTFTPPKISFVPSSGAAPVDITVDPRGEGVNGLSQFAGTNNAVLRDQDGFASGELQNFTIDRTGTIVGSYTNGTSQVLGQIALADFNNPSGLLRIGDNMYGTSGNSGNPVLAFALEGSQSTMTSGALEMSNVDLAQEFTNMIVAQRGFQANSRVITTADEILQELTNLKR